MFITGSQRVSVPKKGFRAALVQIFFVPATMLPPVEAMVVGLDIFTKDAVPHIYLK